MHKRITIFLLSFVYFDYCNNGSYTVYYTHKVKQMNKKKEVTTMKKIATMFLSVFKSFASLIGIAVLMACVACIPACASNHNTRTMNGEVYSIRFCDDSKDYCTTTIKTEDGNLWVVDDYVCPRFTTLHVTFNTMGTKDIKDDEIVQIVNIWNA